MSLIKRVAEKWLAGGVPLLLGLLLLAGTFGFTLESNRLTTTGAEPSRLFDAVSTGLLVPAFEWWSPSSAGAPDPRTLASFVSWILLGTFVLGALLLVWAFFVLSRERPGVSVGD